MSTEVVRTGLRSVLLASHAHLTNTCKFVRQAGVHICEGDCSIFMMHCGKSGETDVPVVG